MKKLARQAAAALFTLSLAGPAMAAEAIHVPERDWSFSGIFGKFDAGARQRGFQVFKEVCAGCHGLRFISFRNLADLGYSPEEVKAIAAEYEVEDGPDEEGEMFMRPAAPFDAFPDPFANEQAARASNNGAYPPDLSLMAEKRVGGENYLYALLVGYHEAPAEMELMDGMYFNEYFPGNQIAMGPPLDDDLVEYADGTPATVEQMAEDVTTFLVWTAEPMLEERRRMGIGVMLFLFVFTGLMYATKRKIWADLH
jgi:ubiquinol-cytochrome c reductase cytochrome c1 subunit